MGVRRRFTIIASQLATRGPRGRRLESCSARERTARALDKPSRPTGPAPALGRRTASEPAAAGATPEVTAMTVTVAGTAGGLDLQFTADDLVPLLRGAAAEAGVDARNLGAGYYGAGSESQVIFQGDG
jgi:hypothetical protein